MRQALSPLARYPAASFVPPGTHTWLWIPVLLQCIRAHEGKCKRGWDGEGARQGCCPARDPGLCHHRDPKQRPSRPPEGHRQIPGLRAQTLMLLLQRMWDQPPPSPPPQHQGPLPYPPGRARGAASRKCFQGAERNPCRRESTETGEAKRRESHRVRRLGPLAPPPHPRTSLGSRRESIQQYAHGAGPAGRCTLCGTAPGGCYTHPDISLPGWHGDTCRRGVPFSRG